MRADAISNQIDLIFDIVGQNVSARGAPLVGLVFLAVKDHLAAPPPAAATISPPIIKVI